MRTLVSGLFGSRKEPSAPCPSDATRITFADGYVDVHRSVQIAQEDEKICIAFGHPRFAQPGDRTSELRNPAHAWIALVEKHGIDAPRHVRGRFAVVFLDARADTLLLAVDRFGTLPLCYHVANDSVAFSDRADGVTATRRPLSTQALFEYFYFHVIPSPRTVFEGVDRLPGGHAFLWQRREVTCRRYRIDSFTETKGDLRALEEEFRGLIDASVALETGEHVTGAFLSGGTDSSTVAGALTKVQGKPAKTFSIGFDVGGYDEMAYARIAARHFGTDHHEYYVTPADLLQSIPKVAAHYDQPFGNSSAAPAFICASMARADGVDKLLAGDGGDELFGGNTRYAKQRVFSWYERLPRSARAAAIEPLFTLAGVRKLPLLRKAGSYIDQARVPMPDRTQMYNLLSRLGAASVFKPGFLAGINADAPLDARRSTWQGIDARTLTNRMLAYDWKYTLADNDLPKVIGSAHLAGVDVGFPLLSDELVDFSLRLPAEWKLKGLKLRWFFKEALRDFLPAAIIAKKKHGFGLPFGLWAVRDAALGRLVQQALQAFGQRNVVRADFLHELMHHRMQEFPGYYGEMVWIIVILEHWLQAHAPDWRFEE